RLCRGLRGRSGHGQDEVEVPVREGLRDRGGVGLLALSVLLIPFDLDPGVLEGLLETVAGGVERRVLHQLRDADLERVLLTASAVAAAGAGRNREYRTVRRHRCGHFPESHASHLSHICPLVRIRHGFCAPVPPLLAGDGVVAAQTVMRSQSSDRSEAMTYITSNVMISTLWPGTDTGCRLGVLETIVPVS